MKKIIKQKKAAPKSKLVRPVTPDEASDQRLASFEPEMITAVNNMIVKNLNSTRTVANVLQKEIVEEYFRVKGITQTPELRASLYERHQLDFEDIFREFGWIVEYDKPAYNESYEANFTFKKKG
jgi:hypothetical protein